jgi:hypothetical protein
MLYLHTPDMYAANMAKNENIPTQIPSNRHLIITRSVKSQNFIIFFSTIIWFNSQLASFLWA